MFLYAGVYWTSVFYDLFLFVRLGPVSGAANAPPSPGSPAPPLPPSLTPVMPSRPSPAPAAPPVEHPYHPAVPPPPAAYPPAEVITTSLEGTSVAVLLYCVHLSHCTSLACIYRFVSVSFCKQLSSRARITQHFKKRDNEETVFVKFEVT